MNAKPVYYHDCPVLGSHVPIVRAMFMSKDTEQVTALYHKCPMCGATAGELITDPEELAKAMEEIAIDEGD